jgi:hypothetical protein
MHRTPQTMPDAMSATTAYGRIRAILCVSVAVQKPDGPARGGRHSRRTDL